MKNQLTNNQIHGNKTCFFYLEGGQEFNSTPIVFIHGWSVSTTPYQEGLINLSQRYRVIAPDLPGFGKSASFKLLHNYDDYADCVINFVKLLDLKKIYLVGHSFGGAVCLSIAAKIPSLIGGLVIVDSTGIPLGSISKVVLSRTIEVFAEINQMKPIPLRQIIQALLHNWLFNPKNVLRGARIVLKQDLKPSLAKVKSPCLILWGENDLSTPLEIGQKLANEIKHSQLLVIKGAYHEWNIFG